MEYCIALKCMLVVALHKKYDKKFLLVKKQRIDMYEEALNE